MTPSEVLARHTSRELTEWQAFYALEPFGPLVDDERAGVISATIRNSVPRKGGKAYQPEDIFPRLKDEAPDDIEADGAKWAAFFAPFRPTSAK